MSRMIWSIIGLAMILVGTVITAIVTINYRKSSDARRDRIESLSESNAKLSGEIKIVTDENNTLSKNIQTVQAQNRSLINKNISLSNDNVKLAQKNVELSNNLAAKTDEFSKYMTGGDGICFLRFYGLGDKKRSAGFRNLSEYPIYINEVRVIDLDCIDKSIHKTTINEIGPIPALDPAAFESCSRKTGPLEIPPGSQITLWDNAAPPTGYPTRFLVNFQTRTGTFTQKIIVTEVDGTVCFANRIERNNEIVQDIIDDKFPPNQIDFSTVQMPKAVRRVQK